VTNKTVRGVKIKKIPLFGRVDKRCRPRPDIAAIKKAQWEDPEFKAKHAEALKASHKADPNKHSRAGVPTGHTRGSVQPLWDRAHELADRFIKIMEDKGELPRDEVVLVSDDEGATETVTVPSTEDGMAKAALREAFLYAVGPGDKKTKIQFINTVLNFTKSKPESRTKLTVNPMSFLDEISDD
jgi:hypothetical protein